MPLNGDPRRIYPQPAPPPNQSPAPHKPGGFNNQPAIGGARSSMPALSANTAPDRASLRPLPTYSKGFEGPPDQYTRPTVTLGQSGPARASSQSRKLDTAAPSRIKSEQPGVAAERAAVAAGVKMEVPNTLMPQSAPPMKHQISQSTDSSVQERGSEQNGNHRSGNPVAGRQTLFGSVGPMYYLPEYDIDPESGTPRRCR